MTSLIADLLDRLDVERRYELEERAGAIEFDGQQTRDQAEVLALVDLLRSHPGALVGVTAYEIDRNGSAEFVITTDSDAAQSIGFPLLRGVDLAELIKGRFDGVAFITGFEAPDTAF